ncbi:MAG: type I restriction-modification enzyme R subunit C-terminal domain-containing protein [Thermaurantiacus sp.]|uniref:type I restriction-modification enzyme R subunit C-terminal domain-containing protein n=1 Tax=Thermaurantiacus sp. TaxID=2820283 RepID=UPI00298ED9FE|nr:type I restriction-modification enzyme R subunit C-terminal domain-containing protein [Thermaurantiacus sp.]MDW8415887.1 type I restriction-modification enzyme R subunit C-terminal domain-containing protein [Thermaurantiacus sp.]
MPLYARPASPAASALTYQSLKELKEAMLKPPWLLKPETLWQAYRRLLPDKVKADPARLLTDLIVLVRFAIGTGTELAPFAVQVRQAFNLWLGREKRAGRDYTAEQRAWLKAMRDEIAANAHLALADIGEVFAGRGGLYAAQRAFGDRLAPMLEDLIRALVA